MPPGSSSLGPHLSVMASANELSPFSSSFVFNLLLIYTLDICIRQPLWLATIRTSLKTKLPCMARRGSLEYRSWATWKFLRPRGVLLHTLTTTQIAFLPRFSWQRGMPSRLLLFWILHTQRLPVHSGNSASGLRNTRVPRACTWVLVQLTSKCAAGRWKGVQASLLRHNSLPCVSRPLSFAVFSQPVSGG